MEISKLDLKKAVKAIKRGKILVVPTDTVYGLVCDAVNKKAVAKLFKIKNRPRGKPVPIFVKDIKMAKKLAFIGKKQEEFLNKVWPGKITVLLPHKDKKGKIGLRMPNYHFLLSLMKHTGPLAESSANVSGRPSSVKIKEVLKQFEGRKRQPDLVIDRGDLKPAKPSKIIGLTVWPPKILRT